MKLLVGRKFDDADVQKELSRHAFKAVKMAHGGVGVSITYNDQPLVVSAEHFMAMLLVHAKEISAKANGGLNLADSVMAVPHWFTNSQRRGILNACKIASMNCLKVTNESNSIALSYGIFKSAKKLFSDTEPSHIMFVDLGFTGYCVTIVDFIQENMKVLSTVCDRDLSGRQFDDIIIEFLAEQFENKTKINVRNNKKAILKLQAAAEKAKKTLSPAGVNEAAISVECLAEDIDLNCSLTREEFEKRASKFIERLRGPVEQALKEANLTKEQIHECEIVGGSSRVNIVKRTLGEILGLDQSLVNYGLKTTMNSDEAVARGAALQCAMLSSRMKVKPFNIIDRLPYGIVAHFDVANNSNDSPSEQHDDEEEAGTAAKGSSVSLYARNDEFPHKPRRVTFRQKTHDFAITLMYDDAAAAFLPEGESKFIGKYTIRVPSEFASEPSDVRVTFNLDRHGCVIVQSAQLMQLAKGEEGKEDAKEGKEDEKSGDKKKYHKVDLKVDVEEPGLTETQIKEALELEANMAYEDRLIIETADKRNELEAYIYAMRSKLDGALKEFATSSEKDKLKSLMTDAEDWLYNEGFDSTKQEYERKIGDLRKLGNPIDNRYNQHQNRPGAVDSLKKQIELCKNFTANYDDAHSHITEDERDKLRKETQATEEWMYDFIGRQADSPLSAEPVLTVESIAAKRNSLFSVANPILTKPKPKPATEAKPADSKAGDDKHSETPNASGSEPMDQAKGESEDSKSESK